MLKERSVVILLKKLSFLTAGILVMLFIIVFVVDKNATAADNNLYNDEVYNKYYYEQLSESSKYVYDSIYSVIDKTMTGMYEIKIDLSEYNVPVTDSTTCFQSAIDALDRDHPEVFWLDYNKIEFKYSIVTTDNIQCIRNVYVAPGEFGTYLIDSYKDKDEVMADFNDVSDYVEEVLPAINAFNSTNATYDKLRYIHDLLVKTNEYNSDYDNASIKAHKCVSAIPGNTTGEDAPVCEGYSRAFKVLCDNANIPCILVTGEGITAGNSIPHMWNYVMIDDRWYAIDVTWDDPILSGENFDNLSNERKYKYFLKGSSEFLNNHYENNVFVSKENYNFSFGYPIIEYEDYEIYEETYSITIDNLIGGTITTNLSDNNYVTPGTVVKLTISANEGMKFVPGSLKINDKYYFATSFIMPASEIIIHASFEPVNTERNDDTETEKEQPKKEPPTKEPSKEQSTKTPATDKPAAPVTKDESGKEIPKEEITDSPDEKHEIITIESSEELENGLKNVVDDFDENTEIKVTINNHTSMEKELIKVGHSHTSIEADTIISFYKTIFDSKELEQMLFASEYSTNYFSHIDSFSIQASKASNGTPITLDEGEYFSLLLPLSDIYYDNNFGILLLDMNESVLTEHDYSIINYGKRYYICFKTFSDSSSYMVVYKSERENVTVKGDSYVSPAEDEITTDTDITSPKEEDNSRLITLAYICITIMLLILLFIIIFEIYMFYLNKA